MGKVKEALLSDHEALEALLSEHETLEDLYLWGCLRTVAQTVVNEVLSTGTSETMDELLSTIQRLYSEQRPKQLYS